MTDIGQVARVLLTCPRKTGSARPELSPGQQALLVLACLREARRSPGSPLGCVAESLLDRLINNSHQAFMSGPSYRPRKRPGQRVTTLTKEATQ